MVTIILWIGIAIAWILLSFLMYYLLPHHIYYAIFALFNGTYTAWYAITQSGLFIRIFSFTLTAYFAYWWWKTRPPKNKGRIRRAIGARIQAIIDGMIKAMKPAPGGAK